MGRMSMTGTALGQYAVACFASMERGDLRLANSVRRGSGGVSACRDVTLERFATQSVSGSGRCARAKSYARAYLM